MRPWSFSTVEDLFVLYSCTNGCRILRIAIPKHVAHFKIFTKLSNAIICSEKFSVRKCAVPADVFMAACAHVIFQHL